MVGAIRLLVLGERVRNLIAQGFPSRPASKTRIESSSLRLLDIGDEPLPCDPARLVTKAANNILLFRGELVEAANRSEGT